MIVIDPRECTAGVAAAIDDGADRAGECAVPFATPCGGRQLVAGNDQHAPSAIHELAQPRSAIPGGRRNFIEDDERPALELRRRKTADLPHVDAERRPVTDRERAREKETLIRARRR